VQRQTAAEANPKAPKKSGGIVRELTSERFDDQWSFAKMIDVAVDLGIVSAGASQQLHPAVREFRNLVHPRVHAKGGLLVDEHEATAVSGAVGAVVRDVRAAAIRDGLLRGVAGR